MLARKLVLFIMIVFVLSTTASLLGNIDQRTRDYIREFGNRPREWMQNQRSITGSLHNSATRNMVISDRVFQFVDYYSGDWANWDKEEFSYDNQGRLNLVSIWFWNDQYDSWIESGITVNIHWNMHNRITQLVLNFSSGPYDMDMWVITNSYNTNHQLTEMLFERWDEDEEELVLDGLWQIYYDNSGRAEAIVLTDYMYGIFINMDLTYDSQGRFHEIIDSVSWDGENWELWDKTVFSYHPNDQSNYAVFQNFLNHLAMFMYFEQVTWIPEPMYASEYYYEWYDEWELWDRAVYAYDTSNRLISVTWEDFYGDNMWEPWERYLYNYNTQGYLHEILQQYYYGEWNSEERILITMGDISSTDDVVLIPEKLSIRNYPNPFNPETTISFQLPTSQQVELSVLNIKGQVVTTLINEVKDSGTHNIVWNGRDSRGNSLSSGVYFYRIKTETGDETGKMLLLK